MVTETKGAELKNGLRLLAHMIARAYLKDLRGKEPQPVTLQDKKEEGKAAVCIACWRILGAHWLQRLGRESKHC